MLFVVIKDKEYENKGSDEALWWKTSCCQSHLAVLISTSDVWCHAKFVSQLGNKQDTAENTQAEHVRVRHQKQPW